MKTLKEIMAVLPAERRERIEARAKQFKKGYLIVNIHNSDCLAGLNDWVPLVMDAHYFTDVTDAIYVCEAHHYFMKVHLQVIYLDQIRDIKDTVYQTKYPGADSAMRWRNYNLPTPVEAAAFSILRRLREAGYEMPTDEQIEQAFKKEVEEGSSLNGWKTSYPTFMYEYQDKILTKAKELLRG